MYSKNMDLDSWVRMFEEIYYPTQNFHKSELQILQRLVEQLGDIAKFAAKRPDPGELGKHLCIAFGWMIALCIKYGLRNVAELVWHKFPNACPYCACNPCECSAEKAAPKRSELDRLRRDNRNKLPRDLFEWQSLFDEIYSERNVGDAEQEIMGEIQAPLFVSPRKLSPLQYRIMLSFAHLCEEIGETSRAMRERYFRPQELEDEIADIFAWIMSIANLINRYPSPGTFKFADHLWRLYPGFCRFCGSCPCACSGAPVEDVITAGGVLMSLDYDKLTGVGSADAWRALEEKADAEPKAITRALPLGVIYVDLNNFKKLQDCSSRGHDQGDEILHEVGAILNDFKRRNIIPFRIGGDEFLVLAGNTEHDKVTVLAQRIRDEIANHQFRNLDGSTPLQITAAIGYASSEKDGHTLGALKEHADKRMYEDKAGPHKSLGTSNR